MDIDQAVKIYAAAHEYPRCGEAWPLGQAEEAAHAALGGRDPLTGRTPEEEAAFDAAWDADLAARKARREQAAAAKQARIDAAFAASNGDLVAFVSALGAEGVDRMVAERLFDYHTVSIAIRDKRVILTRRGTLVC